MSMCDWFNSKRTYTMHANLPDWFLDLNEDERSRLVLHILNSKGNSTFIKDNGSTLNLTSNGS